MLHMRGLEMSNDNLVEELLEAGIHFGQHRSNWNPKMRDYIFGVQNQIHIIDLRETVRGLLLAKRFLQQVVADGKDVCLVGTKRQAKNSIQEFAQKVSMPYVNERWLGGTLTNFRTIRERLGRLVELEQLVESGAIDSYSKKMTSQLLREKTKITRNLSGIRNMHKLPGALFIVDTNVETNALREARTLGITTVGLIDTDGDPDVVDIAIPGNDDSIRSINIITRELCSAIKDGLEGRRPDISEKVDKDTPKRRSSRSQFKSDDSQMEEHHNIEGEKTPETSDLAQTGDMKSE